MYAILTDKTLFCKAFLILDSMNKKEIIRHIAGYSAGIFIFLVFIPFLLCKFSIFSLQIMNIKMIPDSSIYEIVSILLSAVGLLFIVWSNLYLFFVGRGGPAQVAVITLSPKTKYLVTTGPYRYTRNPMMFGGYTLNIAIAIYLKSLPTLLLLFLIFPLIIIFLKHSEEKRLLKDFGNKFIEYKKRVPIFFPYLRDFNR